MAARKKVVPKVKQVSSPEVFASYQSRPLSLAERIDSNKKANDDEIQSLREYAEAIENAALGLRARLKKMEERLTELERHVG